MNNGKKMKTTAMGLYRVWGLGMEKTMETTIMRYTGPTIRIHSFIPS